MPYASIEGSVHTRFRNPKNAAALQARWGDATTEQRFWSKVNKDGPEVRPGLGPCWVWTSRSVTSYGYGVFRVGGTVVRAHRYAYELLVGPIAIGRHACHHCDNPACVRPEHIFTGTHRDNMQDAARKGRMVPRPMIGEKHPRAKLTEVDVIAIRCSRESGVAIANRYGLSKSHVSAIRKHQSWSHLRHP